MALSGIKGQRAGGSTYRIEADATLCTKKHRVNCRVPSPEFETVNPAPRAAFGTAQQPRRIRNRRRRSSRYQLIGRRYQAGCPTTGYVPSRLSSARA